MQDQPNSQPEPDHSRRRFSDAEANEVYKRAAEIESKTLFLDDSLTGAQVEEAANDAGISDEAVDAAIAHIDQERAEARAATVARSKTRRSVLIWGGGVVGIIALNGILNQRGLSARLAATDNAKANVETTLQRRQDLMPTVLRLAKENLSNERELIAALNRPVVDGATLKLAQQKLEARGIENAKIDEIAGTENRIAVARRRFNESATEYNRAANSFPTSLWRSAFRFPSRVEPFAADKNAQIAPRFD